MTPNTDKAAGQSPQTKPQTKDARIEPANLGHRYGTIGIDAVAAAMHYAGSCKNPAYAPATERIDNRFFESAA